jgi:hypothetical protein
MHITFKTGFGIKEIPSPVGTELCGYGYYLGRTCDASMDPLHVRCIALVSGETKSLVFSADLIGLTEELHQQVRRFVSDKLGYSGREVMILCTHTHTGPATNYLEGCGVMNEDYNSRIPAVFLAAAEQAVADLAMVEEMEECCQPIEPVGFNRDFQNGPHDAVVRGVRIRRTGRPPVAMISYPCHPVVLGASRQSSADFPGAVCRMGEENGMKTILLNGCCGDINPLHRLASGGDPRKLLDDNGRKIFDGFLQGLHSSDDMELKNAEFNTVLPLRTMGKDEIDALAKLGGNARVAEIWRESMLANPPGATDNITVRCVRIGAIIFCSLPFETFTAVGDMVRQAYPGRNIAVLGCADHNRSYLPVITPEWQHSYPVVSAAMLYGYPIIASDAVESIGGQIASGIRSLIGNP